eukprot:3614449-Pyramimonas_sp.AAC.1
MSSSGGYMNGMTSAGGGGCGGRYMHDGDHLVIAANAGAGVVPAAVVLLALGVFAGCCVRCAGGGLHGRWRGS